MTWAHPDGDHKIPDKILTTKKGMESQLFSDFLAEETNERKYQVDREAGTLRGLGNEWIFHDWWA